METNTSAADENYYLHLTCTRLLETQKKQKRKESNPDALPTGEEDPSARQFNFGVPRKVTPHLPEPTLSNDPFSRGNMLLTSSKSEKLSENLQFLLRKMTTSHNRLQNRRKFINDFIITDRERHCDHLKKDLEFYDFTFRDTLNEWISDVENKVINTNIYCEQVFHGILEADEYIQQNPTFASRSRQKKRMAINKQLNRATTSIQAVRKNVNEAMDILDSLNQNLFNDHYPQLSSYKALSGHKLLEVEIVKACQKTSRITESRTREFIHGIDITKESKYRNSSHLNEKDRLTVREFCSTRRAEPVVTDCWVQKTQELLDLVKFRISEETPLPKVEWTPRNQESPTGENERKKKKASLDENVIHL